MNDSTLVKHYSHGQILDAIRAGITALCKSTDTITIDDLAAVDEFHIGGREATEHLVDQLALAPGNSVLDVGCGLGGTARFVAETCGCRVVGIDLTPEFVKTGQALTSWVGLDDRVTLQQGSALDMPFGAREFDAATMLHLGMNIADKSKLFTEVHRVLKPGCPFGIYDIMRTSDEALDYPVPWAKDQKLCVLGTLGDYRSALHDASFEILHELNRREFAADFFAAMRERMQSAEGPPPLGLHILFGEDAPLKVKNMVGNIAAGRAAPIEVIARTTS